MFDLNFRNFQWMTGARIDPFCQFLEENFLSSFLFLLSFLLSSPSPLLFLSLLSLFSPLSQIFIEHLGPVLGTADGEASKAASLCTCSRAAYSLAEGQIDERYICIRGDKQCEGNKVRTRWRAVGRALQRRVGDGLSDG